MARDGEAACPRCGGQIDPTVTFQCCVQCGGRLRRKLTRYACASCGALTDSRFNFDPARLDRAYFRRMMGKSRERRGRRRAALIARLQQSRSGRHVPGQMPRLEDVPDLATDLDRMAGLPLTAAWAWQDPSRPRFDLGRYRAHVLNALQGTEMMFDHIPPLIDDGRLDRVFRFVAVVYLQHDGQVDLVQYREALVVGIHEPDREG
jgi:hypothetical protein